MDRLHRSISGLPGLSALFDNGGQWHIDNLLPALLAIIPHRSTHSPITAHGFNTLKPHA